MQKAYEIIDYLEKIANPKVQEKWDNSGWQISTNREVERIMLCLDLNMERVDRAIDENIELIITHHPFFFKGIKSIGTDYKSTIIRKLLNNNIGLYSAHTSLDFADTGVNKVFFDFLELSDEEVLLETKDGNNLGLVGKSKIKTIEELSIFLQDNLLQDSFRIYGKQKKIINKIGILGGAGASEIDAAISKNCDVFITSDVKHHDAQYAYENDLIMIDISHNDSEKLVLDYLKNEFESNFKVNCLVLKENAFILKID